jgi:hypothetical protein
MKRIFYKWNDQGRESAAILLRLYNPQTQLRKRLYPWLYQPRMQLEAEEIDIARNWLRREGSWKGGVYKGNNLRKE